MPRVFKPVLAVTGAEFPERRIPRCAVAIAHARAGGHQPALHHFPQETVAEQPFPVRAAQLARPEDAAPALLKLLECAERFRQFFVRFGHDAATAESALLQAFSAANIQAYYAA